mmetsp:Transcript_25297/g.53938  ORF Transcript_25297/g.53938 Transcript_25297/m.53938 type:complete len:106 (+) Transcript_25297:31-348(+)
MLVYDIIIIEFTYCRQLMHSFAGRESRSCLSSSSCVIRRFRRMQGSGIGLQHNNMQQKKKGKNSQGTAIGSTAYPYLASIGVVLEAKIFPHEKNPEGPALKQRSR